MAVAVALRHGLRLLLPLALACTFYLYLYPVFHGCAFPVSSRIPQEAFEETKKLHWPYADRSRNATATATEKMAPFRLLALGDPQLEGDTSIPIKIYGILPHVKKIAKRVTFRTTHSSLLERIRMILHDVIDVFFEDIPNILESIRKHFDHLGNDFYLAHIFRTVRWWTQPTHVTVLGDLVGSQWIDDAEFEKRGARFWNRAFHGAERLSDELAMYPEQDYALSGFLDGSEDEKAWARRLLNVAGNHDIGYAGDLTEERVERFERVFGKVNYELRFELPVTDALANATILDFDKNPLSLRLAPEIRIVVMNDMNLDTPAKSVPLQDQTYAFINKVISHAHAVEFQGQFTLVLTHIPTHKPKGICVDEPFFDFHTAADGGGVKEQYLLSADASKGFYEGILGISGNTKAANEGRGRPGLILNGHDHEGCDTYHYINQTNGTSWSDRSWEVTTWADAQALGVPGKSGHPGRREITVRSMMGGFGGNAGLLSLWFDFDTWEWVYEYMECPLGTQHFWWLAHTIDLLALVNIALLALVGGLESRSMDVDKHASQCVAWARERISRPRNGTTNEHATTRANISPNGTVVPKRNN